MDVLIKLAKIRVGQSLAQAGADLAEDAQKDPEWLEFGKTLVGIAMFKTGLDMMKMGDDQK